MALPWYRSLSGPQWKTLVAANLSWTRDSFEFFALFLTVGFALHQLVAPETNGRPLPEAVEEAAVTTPAVRKVQPA